MVPSHPDGRSQWALGLAVATAVATLLGYALCVLAGALPARAVAAVILAAAGALAGSGAGLVLERRVLAPSRMVAAELEAAQVELAGQAALPGELGRQREQFRRLRHDLRGALSPVMLVADRLGSHADPAVKRSGEIMMRAVERATAVLQETEPVSPREDS